MSLKVKVQTPEGKSAGTVDLPEEIFNKPASVALLHQVVIAQLAAARQGTHAVKNRHRVRGGGRKPYRQKGTGNARQGSIRAPQFTGGAVAHGPVPRDYSQRTNKKMIAAALKGALTDRAQHSRIHVIEEVLTGQTPSTKTAKAFLEKISERKKQLVVLGRDDIIAWKSVNNLPHVHAIAPDQLNTYDVLNSDDVIFTLPAFQSFVDAHSSKAAKEVSA